MRLQTLLHVKKARQVTLCATLSAMMLMTTGFTRAGVPTGMQRVDVRVDGRTITTTTVYGNPNDILDRVGVRLGADDTYDLKKVDDRRSEILVHRAVPVTIDYEGTKRNVMTTRKSVAQVLLDAGYAPEDIEVTGGMDADVTENMTIAVRDSEAKRKAVELARQQELERQRTAMVETSRGMQRYSAAYMMEATAYLPNDGGGSGVTASGMMAQRGVVAVDTDVIPLGTRLYIPGYGEAIAGDTGGAISGNRIDLCMEDYGEAIQFGRRDVTVYVLE
ncbi:3D domain-containing protein [uncultured Mitsuokella sp.]|uniref:3D domain-containing protein n=1 Tax=uncultured Mitsuokella sp. TaxID=453120 RepID=UPI00260A5828|nr:3D domain-containing protein [uncultured Mitsuokella sp.]